MKDEANTVKVELAEIILTPIEILEADYTTVRTEDGTHLLAEDGRLICEG